MLWITPIGKLTNRTWQYLRLIMAFKPLHWGGRGGVSLWNTAVAHKHGTQLLEYRMGAGARGLVMPHESFSELFFCCCEEDNTGLTRRPWTLDLENELTLHSGPEWLRRRRVNGTGSPVRDKESLDLGAMKRSRKQGWEGLWEDTWQREIKKREG